MSIHHKLSSNCRDSHVVAAAAAQSDASYFPGGANVQQCNIYIVPWAHASPPPVASQSVHPFYRAHGLTNAQITTGMLTRPAGHEAKAEAETRKSEAEDEAEAQKIFRGRGHNV